MKAISLVVPVYDEEERLPAFLRRLDVSRFREAIFVLNGCTDGSAGLVPEGARMIVLPKNRGKGFALKKGFLAARKGGLVAFVDADGTFSTSQVLSACRAAQRSRADLCISRRRKFPAKRGFLRGGLRAVNGILFGISFQDTQCGLKVLDRRGMDGVVRSCVSDGYELDVELVWRALAAGRRVAEFPLDVSEPRTGRSKFSELLDPPAMLLSLLRLRLGLGRGRNPEPSGRKNPGAEGPPRRGGE